jgi:CheY-like chemotaxis protein
VSRVATKTVIFGNKEMDSFLRLLKGFLFKVGLKESLVTSNLEEVVNLVHNDFWPIIFIDHTEGVRDGFVQFESVYKNIGFEMFPYFLMAPADKKIFKLFGASTGVAAVLSKPLQPKEIEQLLRQYVPANNDPLVEIASHASKLIFKKDFVNAKTLLGKLSTQPKYSFSATISSIRCDIAMGSHSIAEQKLKFLNSKDPKNIRVMIEYSELMKKNLRLNDVLDMYSKIRKMHPNMYIKIWEQILLYLELDLIDEASILLDELQTEEVFRDFSTDGLIRILYQFGLQQHLATALKLHPVLQKKYSAVIQEIQISQKASFLT